MYFVVITGNNDMNTFPRAVVSAERAGRDDVEIVLVDNGSTDPDFVVFVESFAKKRGFRHFSYEEQKSAEYVRAELLKILMPASNDVVVWMSGRGVMPDGGFDRLDELYSDSGVNVTYGEVFSHRGKVLYGASTSNSVLSGQSGRVKF